MSTGVNTLHAGTDVVVEGEARARHRRRRAHRLARAWEDKYGAEWHFEPATARSTTSGGARPRVPCRRRAGLRLRQGPLLAHPLPLPVTRYRRAVRAPEVREPTELLGTWRLDRRIVDRRRAAAARSDGSAGRSTLTADDGAVGVARARARSPGTGSTWPCLRDAARRRRRPAGGPSASTTAATFHPWRPGTPVVHPCRADTYAGSSPSTPGGDLLRVLWDVTGPAKDRRLFTRCDANPA